MASPLEYVTQGSRIFLTSWKQRFFPQQYNGTAEEICKQVIDDCWNGRYFMTSTNNFRQFWTRDFGLCSRALVKLGYQEKVHATLRYALNRFQKAEKITTTITPFGKPFDFPVMAVDSLPWLIHAITVSKFPYYSFKTFLEKEIKKYHEAVISEHTGLVKPNVHFSSLKDFAVRKSSCYDNCMIGMLALDLAKMKLHHPFAQHNYAELVVRHFWNGSYFYDDLSKKEYVAGDANIFPFLSGLIKDEAKLRQVIRALQKERLDQPFPLRYTTSRKQVEFLPQELLLRNYENNTVWMHMGPLFVLLVQQIDPAKAAEYKQAYKQIIEHHRNFLEVFNEKGKPFQTLFYHCDSGMLWAANYLIL